MKPTFAASLALLVAAAASYAAPPASQPTTKPSSGEFPALQKRLREVLADNAVLKDNLERMTKERDELRLRLEKLEVASAANTSAATKPTSFSIGWRGTLKGAICREVFADGVDNASIIEFRDEDGRRLGRAMLSDAPFIKELADDSPVPSKYENVRVLITGTTSGFSRTYLVATIVK